MKTGTLFLSVMAFLLWSLASTAAVAEQNKVLIFEVPDNAGLGEDEVETLLSVVAMGLQELPRETFSVEVVKRSEVGVGEACDEQCLLDYATGDEASHIVVCELKKIKKRQRVLTITLLASADGQVLQSSVSEVCADLNELMDAARVATENMKEKLLAAAPRQEPEPPPPAVDPATPPEPSAPAPGTLKINSAPPGANVVLKGSKREPGKPAGTTPLELSLKPWTYWVTLTREGYKESEARATVGAGQTVELNIEMKVDKWPPLRIAAHATLWPGLAFGLLGGTAGYMSWRRGNQYDEELDQDVADMCRQWAIVMYAAGGLSAALVTTSIIFFVLGKKEKKRAARSGRPMAGAAPVSNGEGAVFVLGGRF